MFRTRACARIYRLSFFLRVALLLHGTSGHVPPATTPASPPVLPVTKPPTLDAPERTPARPTLVTSATSFFARFYVLSVLLFHPLAADTGADARAHVCHFNKNLLTFPTPRTRTRRVSLAQARNCHWTIPRDVNDPLKSDTVVQIVKYMRYKLRAIICQEFYIFYIYRITFVTYKLFFYRY